MKNRVITINGEFGSGGRNRSAKKVASAGYSCCYDAEIIQEMAKETGFAPDYVKKQESTHLGAPIGSFFQPNVRPHQRGYSGEHQYKVITELAEKVPALRGWPLCRLYSAG